MGVRKIKPTTRLLVVEGESVIASLLIDHPLPLASGNTFTVSWMEDNTLSKLSALVQKVNIEYDAIEHKTTITVKVLGISRVIAVSVQVMPLRIDISE